MSARAYTEIEDSSINGAESRGIALFFSCYDCLCASDSFSHFLFFSFFCK